MQPHLAKNKGYCRLFHGNSTVSHSLWNPLRSSSLLSFRFHMWARVSSGGPSDWGVLWPLESISTPIGWEAVDVTASGRIWPVPRCVALRRNKCKFNRLTEIQLDTRLGDSLKKHRKHHRQEGKKNGDCKWKIHSLRMGKILVVLKTFRGFRLFTGCLFGFWLR